MSGPSVGVVMPARDAARYIAESIASVLDQSAGEPALVVVDDGSTDETATVAASFGPRVTVIQQPPLGPAAARNHGLRSLSTDLLALLDADDVWPRDSLAVRLRALADDPSTELAFGQMVQFISPDIPPEEQRRLYVDPRPQAAWASSAMLARRGVFERVGLLPEHRRAGDFLEWLLRARHASVRAVMLDEVVLRRRLHMANLSRREPEANAHYLAVVRAELARRRTSAE